MTRPNEVGPIKWFANRDGTITVASKSDDIESVIRKLSSSMPITIVGTADSLVAVTVRCLFQNTGISIVFDDEGGCWIGADNGGQLDNVIAFMKSSPHFREIQVDYAEDDEASS